MTLEEAYDRWERIARLVCENAKRSAKRSREQTKQLKAYVDAVREYNVATVAMEERPEDVNAKETLVEAREALNRARETLRNTLRH
jgi:Na+/phosphate symporter